MRGGGVGGLKDRRHWRRSGMRCKGHARGVRAAVAHRMLLRQPCLEGARRVKAAPAAALVVRPFCAPSPPTIQAAAPRARATITQPLVIATNAILRLCGWRSPRQAVRSPLSINSAALCYRTRQEARQSFVLRRRVERLQTNRDPHPVGIVRGRTPIRIQTLEVYATIQ